MDNQTKDQLIAWLLSDSTGLSAKAIAKRLSGVPARYYDHPSDGSDFGRCERMLDAVPAFRARLPEMASANPYWAALVPHWDEIRESPDKHALIRKLTAEAEKADRSTVRLGPNATIRFGS